MYKIVHKNTICDNGFIHLHVPHIPSLVHYMFIYQELRLSEDCVPPKIQILLTTGVSSRNNILMGWRLNEK